MLFADEDRLENPQSNVKPRNFHCGLKRLFQHAIQEGARQVCISGWSPGKFLQSSALHGDISDGFHAQNKLFCSTILL